MSTAPAYFPKLSLYDPAESSEGSLDPLGLAQLATSLGDALVPGFTERSRRPRFLVALAFGARVFDRAGYPEGAYGDHADGPANIAFERLLLESFAHEGRTGEPGLIGVPGIGKARDAAREQIRLSSARYLVAPGAVGLWVAYKRLAQELEILDGNGHLLENGYELLRAWEHGVGRPGVLTSTRVGDLALLEQIDDALRPLLGDAPARTQPRSIWKSIYEFLRPHGLTRPEAAVLRRLLVDRDPDRGSVFRAIEGQGRRDAELFTRDEAAMLRSLKQRAGGLTVSRVRTILAYERVATILMRVFRCILFSGGRRSDGRVDAVTVSENPEVGSVFSSAPDELEVALSKAHPLLQAVGEGGLAEGALGWLAAGALESPHSLFDALLLRHFGTQRRKLPDGKRPWIEGDESGYFVRTRYAMVEAPGELTLEHPYRTLSVRFMLRDLWEAER